MATVTFTTDQYRDDYEGTSATSFTLGTSGSQVVTADTGKLWYSGMTIELTRSSDVTVYQYGTVTAYDDVTGALTFTKNSGGAGSGTYSDWIIGFRRGDTIAISSFATVTQRQSNATPIGSISSTQGTYKVLPTDTSKPMLMKFWTYSGRLTFTANGTLRIGNGDMVDIYTGDGTAGQTIISGGTIGGVAIGYPSYVEVDDGVTVEPWAVWPTVYSGGTPVNTTDFSSGSLGKVLFWNHTTGTLTCGDGTNGNVIPNGATVRFPCIVIDAYTSNATFSSRAQFALYPAGTLYMNGVNITEKVYLNAVNFYAAELHKTGAAMCITFSNSSGNLKAGYDSPEDWVIVNNDPTNPTNIAFQMSNISGRVKAQNIIGSVGLATGTCQGISINTLINADIGNLRGFIVDRVATVYPINITNANNVDDDGNAKVIEKIIVGGGSLYMANNVGQVFYDVEHSDRHNSVISSSVGTYALYFNNNNNCIVHKVRKCAAGASQYSYFIYYDPQSKDCILHDIDYDASDNGNALAYPGGVGLVIANSFYTQSSGKNLLASGPGDLKLHNIRGGYAYSSVNILTLGWNDGVVASNGNQGVSNYPDANPYNVWFDVGRNPTTGTISVGAFAAEQNKDLYDITGSSIYVDNAGNLFIGTSGDSIVIKNVYPIRAITSYQAKDPAFNGTTPSTGLTYEFRVANAGVGDWTSWASLTGANLAACLALLTDYDSDIGHDMQIRISATTTYAARNVNRIYWLTNVDSGYSPDIGTAKVGVSGAITGTRIAAFTYPGGDLIGTTLLSSDTGYVNCPYAFVGGENTVTLRVRYPGYAPIVFNVDYDQRGAIIPVVQVENKDITGVPIYGRGTGATDSLFDFNIADLRVDIGDGRGNAEDLYDLVCEYQATVAGIQAPEILTFDGRDILLDPLSAGWRIRRWHVGDTNAGLDALPVLASNPMESPDDETNGSVDFAARAVRTLFSANDTQAIAQAVRAEMDANSVKLKKALTLGQFIGLK